MNTDKPRSKGLPVPAPMAPFKALIGNESIEQLRQRKAELEEQIEQDKRLLFGFYRRITTRAEQLSEVNKVLGPKALLEAMQA